MIWYDKVTDNMKSQMIYSYSFLISELKQLNPELSSCSYKWAINDLVKSGKIIKTGYNEYALPGGIVLPVFEPSYSELAVNLAEVIRKQYPYVQFTLFETVLMNEFLNHLIAQNTVFLQVEKDSSIFVFRYLQECGFKRIMYKPSKRDYDLYWEKDTVIVTDLISEAPMKTDKSYLIVMEKMLVDICADKLISATFSKAELPDIYEQSQNRYRLDKTKMLRYARRRNKADEVKKYLK